MNSIGCKTKYIEKIKERKEYEEHQTDDRI